LRSKRIFTFPAILLVLCFITYHCANPVSPSGGPVDTSPPLVISCEPENYSIGFDLDRAIINFDEFVKLTNIGEQVIISPPVKEMPEFSIKGKSVIIDFKEELLENSTYNIFFGNAISDITEGNPISNFSYVFSTGNYLDSLSVEGSVANAFDLNPEEGVFVMLYPLDNDTVQIDSLPYKVRPFYVSRTDETGHFLLNNLKDEEFLLFALRDVNSNFLYDQPNEEIAFSDDFIKPEYIAPVQPDTLVVDSISIDTLAVDSISIDSIAVDSISIDTLSLEPVIITKLDLFLFQEIDSTQRILNNKWSKQSLIEFYFKFPAKEPEIKIIKPILNENDTLIEYSTLKDTAFIWLINSKTDSISMIISDNNEIVDTLELALDQKTVKNKSKGDKPKQTKLKLKHNIKSASLDLNRDIEFRSDYPLIYYNFSGILLIENEDTLTANASFSDAVKRKIKILHQWKEGTPYKIIFPDSCLTDILNQSNDSILIDFTTKKMEDYGVFNLNFTVKDNEVQYILQLMNDKDVIVENRFLSDSQLLKFEYLKPGNYKIKTITDANFNRNWDTGDYNLKLQPEKVLFFPDGITIRANWELEEDWELQQP